MKTYTLRKVDHSQKSELSADELRGMAKRGELNLEDEIIDRNSLFQCRGRAPDKSTVKR